MRIIRSADPYFSLHSHSRFSANDALPEVKDMVATVAGYGQRALGLTDHGNMAGSVQLYRSCQEAGILPFPGTELYVVEDRGDKKAKRRHMCVAAYTTKGYENLVRLNTRANENFYHKPLVDHNDLADLSETGGLEGIVGTSGCFFGFIAQALVSDDEVRARQLMMAYDGWFDMFVVELQNHNILHDEGSTDDQLADGLWGLAESVGVPVILTQDSHYCHEGDKSSHEVMKRLVSFGPDPDDAVFPGDGFHLADNKWMVDHHHPKRYAAGMEGLENLLDSHDLAIPEIDHYSYNVPLTVPEPQKDLTARCTAEFSRRKLPKAYADRMLDELEIVEDTGMAGYLLLVAQVTDWCQEQDIFYQARGSASGSILCWLLNITQMDPLKHKLRFERFISRDRTKPPDIDLDVEHTKREEVIVWLKSRFTISQIGTWMKHSIHSEEEDGESKGSLTVKYYMKRRAAGFRDDYWHSIPEQDKEDLYKLGEYDAYSGYGVHAAGLVVTTTEKELYGVVPQMKVASSKTMVTQYDMGDIESMGYVKLDLLGLKALTILNLCIKNLGKSGLDWIPVTDSKTYAAIARGETVGVFQLEGWTAQKGVKRLRPTKLNDVIASMALFRPATMKSGTTDSFIDRKFKKEKIPSRHSIIMSNTVETYGVMVYQEQVISILRDLGMSPDDLTSFLKAVKASNSDIGSAGEVIANYEVMLHEYATTAGMNEDDWDWMWHAIESFASYGFNKSHAAAYGLTAYRCAYLKTHYPVEFFAAVLAVWAGDKKERGYLREARQCGVRVRGQHINESDFTYALGSHKTVRKGFLAIKGLGPKVAHHIIDKRPEGGYQSIEHFCREVGTKVSGVKAYLKDADDSVGVLAKLIDAEVFSGLEEAADNPP